MELHLDASINKLDNLYPFFGAYEYDKCYNKKDYTESVYEAEVDKWYDK